MYVFAFTNLIMKTMIQGLLVKNKEKAEMFITIITNYYISNYCFCSMGDYIWWKSKYIRYRTKV